VETKQVDIVLADDSFADIELMSRALVAAGHGWNIVAVRDGVELLELIIGKEGQADAPLACQPRLIVLDLKMPRLNGFESLKRLKSDPRTRGIPVVIMTSSPERQDMTKATEMGASEYLIKPMTFERYAQLIQDAAARWLKPNTT
jgi:two-component system, response regulator